MYIVFIYRFHDFFLQNETAMKEVFTRLKLRAYITALAQLETCSTIDFECQDILEYSGKETLWGVDGGSFTCPIFSSASLRDKCRHRQAAFNSAIRKFCLKDQELMHKVEMTTAGATIERLQKVIIAEEAEGGAMDLHKAEGHPGILTTYRQVKLTPMTFDINKYSCVVSHSPTVYIAHLKIF